MLVPLSHGRALISFDESMTIARLELRIQDALEDPGLPEDDARIFKSIGAILKTSRRSGDVTLQQRHIIVLESNRPARRRAPPGVPKGRS